MALRPADRLPVGGSNAAWPDHGLPAVTARRALPSRVPPRHRPRTCPEVDCVRDLLPERIVAAAEHRARQIGLGAERVLICADAITEEAYLTALAASLGTAYEALDDVPRAACPLSDDELIQAAAAGLLPLRRDGRLVWIVAPRCLTARRLADPQQPAPAWLKPFRLTSSAHLQHFISRHTQRALGRRASGALQRALPLFSNAPRKRGWRSKVAIALVVLADVFLGAVPAMAIGLFGTALCLIFLATAALRLWSAFLTEKPPKRARDIDDRALPIYTIICPLHREAAVVGDLVA